MLSIIFDIKIKSYLANQHIFPCTINVIELLIKKDCSLVSQ